MVSLLSEYFWRSSDLDTLIYPVKRSMQTKPLSNFRNKNPHLDVLCWPFSELLRCFYFYLREAGQRSSMENWQLCHSTFRINGSQRDENVCGKSGLFKNPVASSIQSIKREIITFLEQRHKREYSTYDKHLLTCNRSR